MRKISAKRVRMWDKPPVANGIDVADNLGLVGFVVKRMSRHSDEFDRVRSEAMIGLFYAARYWNPSKGHKFSTYAVACMIGWVNRFRSREERFRNRKMQFRGKERRQKLHLFSELGSHFTTGKANVFARDADESVERSTQFRELLSLHMGKLKLRHRTVLALRYGLDEGNCYTLEEVGRIFKITRERVRQIEAGALLKLSGILKRENVTAKSIGLAVA